jgi:hypothetical protein
VTSQNRTWGPLGRIHIRSEVRFVSKRIPSECAVRTKPPRQKLSLTALIVAACAGSPHNPIPNRTPRSQGMERSRCRVQRWDLRDRSLSVWSHRHRTGLLLPHVGRSAAAGATELVQGWNPLVPRSSRSPSFARCFLRPRPCYHCTLPGSVAEASNRRVDASLTARLPLLQLLRCFNFELHSR